MDIQKNLIYWTEGTAMNKKCECCGSVRDCEPCCQCKQNTCLDCSIGEGWYCCIICKKSENSENQISEKEKSVLLRKISAKIIKPAFGGKMFGDLIVLQRNPSEIYVWTTLQEFYGENNVELGTGTSLPLRINLNGNPITEDNIVNIEKPGDGSLYGEDIKKIFPENLQKKIENLPSSKVLMQMTEDVKNHPIK